MKTTKHNLNAVALGVALAMGSFTAQAVPENPSLPGLHAISGAERVSDYPTFEAAERTGLALVESSLSLIAARTHIDPTFCSPKTYQVSVDSSVAEVIGQAVITADGSAGSTTLTAVTGEYVDLLGRSSGAEVIVTADPLSSLAGAGISTYLGTHQWSRLNNIFLDSAVWTFTHPQSGRLIPYDEHSIKDYYKRVEDVAGEPESWEYDWGTEVITKEYLPVAKWTELSWYRQQDGEDGAIKVRKDLLSPKSRAPLCRIVYKASGFAPFEYSGTVKVFRPGV